MELCGKRGDIKREDTKEVICIEQEQKEKQWIISTNLGNNAPTKANPIQRFHE
jgi:hypothetical protein